MSCQPIIWNMTAVLRNSVVVVRTRPRAIPLAMITLKIFAFLYEYGAPLGGNSVRRRSANIFTFNLPTNKEHSVLEMGDYWSSNHNGDFKFFIFFFFFQEIIFRKVAFVFPFLNLSCV